MKINRLVLSGYKRIALTGYSEIDISFTRKIQLILGMNSSGKSSLMNELSPLPVANSDLVKDGFKRIWIEHNGVEYKLENGRGMKHSFIRLDTEEELNPGGTGQVQKELIKQVFGYTPEIHQLLIGKELFTEMRPARRKEWMTLLADTDYDFALKVFAALKERLRDTTGALKIARRELVSVVDERIDESGRDVLAEEITRLENRLEALNAIRDNSVANISKDSVEAGRDKAFTAVKTLLDLYRNNPDVNRAVDYTSLITGDNSRLTLLQERQNKVASEMLSLDEKLAASSVEGISELEAEVTSIKEEIANIDNGLVLEITSDNPLVALNKLKAVKLEVIDAISSLPVDAESSYNKSYHQSLASRINSLEAEIRETEHAIEVNEVEIRHLVAHENDNLVECPECKHQFNPAFNANKLKLLQEHNHEHEKHKTNLQHSLREARELFTIVDNYLTSLDRFISVVHSTSELSSLWKYISASGIIRKQPNAIAGVLARAEDVLSKLVSRANLVKRLESVEASLATKRAVNTSELAIIKETRDKLESELSSIVAESEILKANVIANQHKQTIKERIAKGIEVCNRLLDANQNDGLMYIRSTLQTMLMDNIRLVQAELGSKASKLNDMRRIEAKIKDAEMSITRLENEEKTLKLLVAGLSPNSGLIAKGLLGFIGHLVEQMNELINSVWSYSMQLVKPSIGEDKTELDYTFPFTMVNDSNTIADIGLGSKGQQEIINLAFRIVACRYLHLHDIPIFADEFGTGLDETHRKRAAEAIKSITNESAYSQLFMISHYEDAHGALTNAEVCVLCADNITVPKEYNQHVKFK